MHIGLCLVCSFRGTAGVGQGKRDQRDLSKAVVDYICRMQPRGNVTGIRNKKHRKHFNKLLQQLKECRLPGSQKRAYAVSWRMVNTRSFGLPQNRKRIYIMGARRSTRKGVKTRKPNMVHSLPESKFACLDDFLKSRNSFHQSRKEHSPEFSYQIRPRSIPKSEFRPRSIPKSEFRPRSTPKLDFQLCSKLPSWFSARKTQVRAWRGPGAGLVRVWCGPGAGHCRRGAGGGFNQSCGTHRIAPSILRHAQDCSSHSCSTHRIALMQHQQLGLGTILA